MAGMILLLVPWVTARGRRVAHATLRRPAATHLVKEACLQETDPGPSDEELVRAFVARRAEEDFRLLFRRHSPVLLRLAERLLGGDREASEDVVQEVWIRVVDRLPGFRFESQLRTWLCGFVVNRCREVIRSRHEGIGMPAEEPAASTPDTGHVLDLEQAIHGLADGYRAVFVLHDLMGYTHREIASRLGVEEGTSKSQLFLARRALRRRLGGTGSGEERHGG
jgi:RNA polymerase sigma-70 factor (ECF subfamily)